MNIKRLVKKAVKRLREGKKICHGIDPYCDMKARYPEAFSVVFDVGANDGRSAVQFVKEFKMANVYCFEPVRSTYEELESNFGSHARVRPFNFAFGASETTAVVEFDKNGNSRCNTLKLDTSDNIDAESVTVATLDKFCQDQNVQRIDFLKIDTEGFDLEVLKGSQKYLEEQRISFLQVEASMNPLNTKHVKFEDLKSHLESYGYVLFGIYDQTLEWSGETRLRFTNPIFISNKFV